MGNRQDSFRSRAAFSLVEVLLVVTLLAVIAAVAAPSMMGGAGRARMNQAAEEVREAWGEARLDAAASGQTLCFQCVIGGNTFTVGPAGLPPPPPGASTESAATQDGAGQTAKNELGAAGVVFRQLLVAPQPGDPPLGESVDDGEMSPGVLFRPDGSSSDAEAILEDADGRRVRVTLRGLTGSASFEDANE